MFILLVQVIEDPSKSIRLAAEGSDEGSDDEAGGINIQKARQRMREIDQHDKKLYQQRIRMKHRVSHIHQSHCNNIVISTNQSIL